MTATLTVGPDQPRHDTRRTLVGSDTPVRSGHDPDDAHGIVAGADAKPLDGHGVSDTQLVCAVEVPIPPAGAMRGATPIAGSHRLADVHLLLAAEALDDLERTRIANENRHRSMCQVYGLGGTPEEAQAEGLVVALKALEHAATLRLQRAMRAHPLGPWVKATIGVGEKQGARLLAAIGDPYWHPETVNDDGTVRHLEGPRTVSELWAFAGLHVLPGSQGRPDTQSSSAAGDQTSDTGSQWPVDAHGVSVVGVAAKRRKGVKANWSTTAKMRAYLIATSCIKQMSSPYRAVYLDRRTHTAGTHPNWTAGHSHNDALRIVSKALLRDLWRASRELHVEAEA